MYTHKSCTLPSRRAASALLSVLVGVQFASAWAPAGAQSVTLAAAPAQRVAPAFDDHEIGHLRATYQRLARLADDGDAEAARLALRMRHVVPKLFDGSVQVSREQLRRWAGVVAQDDSANCDQPSAETLQLLQG